MPADFTAYLVSTGETLNAPGKQDPFINATQNALNNIGDTAQMGWKAGQIIALSQLMAGGATAGQVPVFDGTNFVPGTAGSTRYAKTTEKDVVNTASKVDLLNGEILIAANVLSANGLLRFAAGGDYLNNTGSNRTFQFELKLGSQVVWDGGASPGWTTSAVRRAWRFVADIQAAGATNAQHSGGSFSISDANAATTGTGALSSSGALYPFYGAPTTLNMTSSQTFTFSVTHSTASASLSMRLEHAYIEILG